jgi:tRNA threonylcarbamoyladenosine biosynthesis protein TsaB
MNTACPGVWVAIDTSCRTGSLALAVNGAVKDSEILDVEGRQAAHLVPALERMLNRHSLVPPDLSAFLVGSGPGSFTGVRIGVATARGVGHALGIPVWPYGSLEGAYFSVLLSLGLAPRRPREDPTATEDSVGVRSPARTRGPGAPDSATAGPPILVLFDARADRVYGAGWMSDGVDDQPFLPPSAMTLGELDPRDFPKGVQLCGTGAQRHASVLRERGFNVLRAPLGAPSAVGLIGVHLATDPAFRPSPLMPGEVWAPDYLRPSQPERLAAALGRASVSSPGDVPGVDGAASAPPTPFSS